MRRVLWAAALAGVLAGCSGGGGDTGDPPPPPPTPVPTFRCSDSPASADQVSLLCGGKVGDVWRIDAKIGVPTQATDIAGFAFDVLFDPALLAFVPESGQAGNFFFRTGSAPLVSAQIASGDPGRLIVGIHSTGTEGGLQGVPGYEHIVRFSMKAATEAPFDPQLIRFDNAQALDPSDQPIASVSFSDQLLLSRE